MGKWVCKHCECDSFTKVAYMTAEFNDDGTVENGYEMYEGKIICGSCEKESKEGEHLINMKWTEED